MITPEPRFVMWRAAARATTNPDFTIVSSGTMNCSAEISSALRALPYSAISGPTAWNTMSTLPARATMSSMYRSTAA
jgi:hypothetical protein